MRLKYLVAVGVALVFIMVVANGVVGTSDGSNRLAVILVIDDSASVNKLEDPDDKRIDKARSFVGILNESTDVVGLVSTQRSYKSADTYICKGPTQDFGIIYEELDKIKNHSSDDYYGFTNIDEFLIKSIYLLEEMEFKEFEYKVIYPSPDFTKKGSLLNRYKLD
jgi:hypothetical protein